MQIIIILVLVAGVLGGGALWLKGYGDDKKNEGRAEVQATLDAANKSIDDISKAWVDEAVNHESDMHLADQLLEQKATTRLSAVQSRGAQHVAQHPELSAPTCVLPPDVLEDVNAALLGMRREPSVDGMRSAAPVVGQGAALGIPAPAAGTTAAVRGADAAAKGNSGGRSPEADRRDRPLGKVHP